MHVGKQWPRLFKHFIANFAHFGHGMGPTRKMRCWVINWHTPIPTVEDLWKTELVISSVGDYWADDAAWIFYEWICPNDSKAKLTARCKLEQHFPQVVSWNYRWRFIWEAFYDNVFLGRCNVFPDSESSPWVTTPSHNDTPLDWADLTDTSLFRGLIIRPGAATWADQPEYHPYRHEP